jgi:hypothetical protein
MSFKVLRAALLTVSLLASMNAFAAAGPGEGGGGNAVLCYASKAVRDQVANDLKKPRTPLDQIDLRLSNLQPGFKPQLLDLWDARKGHGFPGETSSSIQVRTPEQIYSELAPVLTGIRESWSNIDGIPDESASTFIARIRTLASQWQAEPGGIIKFEDSSFQAYFPSNCLIAQVAFFNDQTGIVHYDARIVSMMERVDQSALRVHEDLYRGMRLRAQQLVTWIANNELYCRMNGYQVNEVLVARVQSQIQTAKTSDVVRATVAHLFSSPSFNEQTQSLLKNVMLVHERITK